MLTDVKHGEDNENNMKQEKSSYKLFLHTLDTISKYLKKSPASYYQYLRTHNFILKTRIFPQPFKLKNFKID